MSPSRSLLAVQTGIIDINQECRIQSPLDFAVLWLASSPDVDDGCLRDADQSCRLSAAQDEATPPA